MTNNFSLQTDLHFIYNLPNITIAFVGGDFGDTGSRFFFVGDYEEAVLNHRLLVLFWYIYWTISQISRDFFISASKMSRLLSVKNGIPHTLKLLF